MLSEAKHLGTEEMPGEGAEILRPAGSE
jgi:hypothetical protein